MGWDRPLTAVVCDYLFSGQPPGALVDLSDTLVVVPTRQAGRRLREAVAASCAQTGGAALSVQVVPPSFFFAPQPGDVPDAPEALVRAAWAGVLTDPEHEAVRRLLGWAEGRGDEAWALQTGRLLQRLRQALSDAGLGVADVPLAMGEAMPEAERWAAMAALEAAYLERVAALGYDDACRRKVRTAQGPSLPEGVRRVVVAGVPDPSLLMLRALEALERSVRIEVLIHAPCDLAEAFDDWGRPVEAFWTTHPIDVPDEARNVRVAAAPVDQAALAADECGSAAVDGLAGVVALGVPDAALKPIVQSVFAERGIPTFDPAEPPVAGHPLGRLVSAYAELVLTGRYAAVAALLRHPHALDALALARKVNGADVLGELDEFQNRHLPWRADDMVERLLRGAQGAGSALRSAIEWVRAIRDGFAEAPCLADAVRAFLQEVYAARTLRLDRPEDLEFRSAAEALDAVLHELDGVAQAACGLDNASALRLVLQRLDEVTYARERRDAELDLDGWLELPWNDAPVLVVTGMNEGIVPDSRVADTFLPDSVRRRLGLRDEAARLARDAFLLRGLIESRRSSGGRVCLIAGQTGAQGDPLKPSRLLFLCRDEELVPRARRLFGRIPEERTQSPSGIGFQLDPSPRTPRDLKALESRRISVTAFRAYLACPFRYYLGHVLRMEAVSDDKPGLEAADYGTLVHDVLRDMAAEGVWREPKPETLAAFLHDRLDGHLAAAYGRRLSLPIVVARESARQRLAALARCQTGLSAEGWELVESEVALEAVLGAFTLRGKIDRIDRHRDSGRLRILDYKTSDHGAEPDKAHLGTPGVRVGDFAAVDVGGKGRRWVDLQLPLYRLLLAAREGRDSEPELGYFNLPRSVTETGVSIWPGLTAALYESARQCAAAVCERIAEREFWPPSERVAYDDFETLLLGDPQRTVKGIADWQWPAAGGGEKAGAG
jgi:ATP-dependent helicase/nuclease subunit B